MEKFRPIHITRPLQKRDDHIKLSKVSQVESNVSQSQAALSIETWEVHSGSLGPVTREGKRVEPSRFSGEGSRKIARLNR